METTTNTHDPLAILTDEEVRVQRVDAGGTRVRLEKGCTEWVFIYGSDYQWRLSYHQTYGNNNRIAGPDCDASGLVVKSMEACERLDTIGTEHG